MDVLNTIVQLLSKEEQRNFKLYANRSRATGERLDLQLFDYIRRSGDNFNHNKIRRKLYGPKGENAYFRLRNRLLTEINKSICLLNWDKNDHVRMLQYLTLSHIYKAKQQFQLARQFLRKAERQAEQLESLEYLDIIFGEFITLSFEILDINPETYIQKRKANRITLNRLREIDNVLAVVTYRLKLSQNLSRSAFPPNELLESTMGEYAHDSEIMKDPRFRFRTYQAVSKILLSHRDYLSLEQYLRETYRSFSEEKLFNKGNHDSKLQMLTYLVNALFKNGKIDESLAFNERLKEGMEEFNHLLYDKYLFFYYNSLATNYSAVNIDKAIETLEGMLLDEKVTKVPQYQVYIYLNLALFLYLKKQSKQALRNLIKLRLQDGYQSTDLGFRFRIDIFELALRYQLRDYETFVYRINQFWQDYEELLLSPDLEKDKALVELIARMNESPHLKKDTELIGEIRDFIQRYEPDDTEIFTYADFLEAEID